MSEAMLHSTLVAQRAAHAVAEEGLAL